MLLAQHSDGGGGVARLKCIIAAACLPMLFQVPSGQAEVDTAPRAETSANAAQPTGPQLTPAELEQLTRDKILVTRRTYRQIFEPYINPNTPVFITSDAVIHAFHVLFNESISRYEEYNTEKLKDILKLVWTRIRPQPESPPASSADNQTPKDKHKSEGSTPNQDFSELRRAAKNHAQIVVAVAIKLLGHTPGGLDDRLGRTVDDEVALVIRADGNRIPEWITRPSAGLVEIDYSRFRPRGYYDRTEALRRYFRAIRWLQSIPFQVDQDKELLAIFMLGKTLTDYYFGDYTKRLEIERFFGCYNDLISQRDDLDLLMASQIVRSRPTDLNTVREYLEKLSSDDDRNSNSSDQPGVLPEPPIDPASAEFRILLPYDTPDTVLFQRTTSFSDFNRAWPSGLEICGLLGSKYADQLLAAKVPRIYQTALIESIDDSRKYFKSKSLYNRYLNCLAALLDETEPDAPPFLNGLAWNAKACNTALAGWSQIRHKGTLQAKETVHTIGGALENFRTGFVEPEPEFFGRLGELVELIKLLFGRCGASIPPRYLVARDLRAFAAMVAERKYPPGAQVQVQLSQDEIAIIERSVVTLSALALRHFSLDDIPRRRQELNTEIRNFAQDVEAGNYDGDPAFQAIILDNHYDIKPLWDQLGDTLRRLEVLAHKQLRGVAFSQRENYFITDFGQTLANIMLYGGDGYRYPKDDVPLVVDVYANLEAGGYFHIGIARPRELLVLYPHQGKEIMCRGGGHALL